MSPDQAEPHRGWRISPGGELSDDDPRLNGAEVTELLGAPGEIRLFSLGSWDGLTLGSAIARKPTWVAAIRELQGPGRVRLSPVGGTIGPSGAPWLGLAGLARLPDPCPRPLDRLTAAIRANLERRLGLALDQGRVAGSWCPGFSDLSFNGRKLAGLGFKLTARWALVRAIVAVRDLSEEQFELLDRCHRVFGEGLDRDALTSLEHLLATPGLSRAGAASLLGLSPEKMSG